MFPSSLLSRLFVPGSLKNNHDGFEFKLKNIIDSGTITGFSALIVDDITHEPSRIVINIGENTISGDQITRVKPVYVRALVEMLVKVQGAALAEGEHNITIALLTAEAGKIQFRVNELLSA